MELIPYYSNETEKITDGDFLDACKWCKKHFTKKCVEYYNSIVEDGFHTCYYGFTVYKKTLGQTYVIYTSMLVNGFYNRKSVNQKVENDEIVYKFTEEKFKKLIDLSITYNDHEYQHVERQRLLELKNASLVDEYTKYKKYVFDTFHEIRSLNNTLSSQSDNVLTISKRYFDGEDDFFRHGIHSILATSGLISSRLASLDILVNSSVIESSIKKPAIIYGKLYKCKQILATYFIEYKVGISLDGESYSLAKINDLFEICPYLIFENYLKYSPKNTNIKATINENEKYILIKIENEGPYHTEEEIKHIFELNYRNPNIEKTKIKGNGVGLYIVKLIFDYLGFEIAAESDIKITRTLNGIKYSIFTTNIKIPIVQKKYSND